MRKTVSILALFVLVKNCGFYHFVVLFYLPGNNSRGSEQETARPSQQEDSAALRQRRERSFCRQHHLTSLDDDAFRHGGGYQLSLAQVQDEPIFLLLGEKAVQSTFQLLSRSRGRAGTQNRRNHRIPGWVIWTFYDRLAIYGTISCLTGVSSPESSLFKHYFDDIVFQARLRMVGGAGQSTASPACSPPTLLRWSRSQRPRRRASWRSRQGAAAAAPPPPRPGRDWTKTCSRRRRKGGRRPGWPRFRRSILPSL